VISISYNHDSTETRIYIVKAYQQQTGKIVISRFKRLKG